MLRYDIFFPLLMIALVLLLAVFSLPTRAEPPTDDTKFRHILALLASTRLVIAIRQVTRT